MLLNDHDTIWANYKYEHILNTRCGRRAMESSVALLSAAAKRFLESTQESKVTAEAAREA